MESIKDIESIKDNPDFCNTVLNKHIYTVSYHKNIKDIENFIFINYQDDDNILSATIVLIFFLFFYLSCYFLY